MWPMKILRFTVLVQVLLLVIFSLGSANGIPPSHTRTSRQIIPLAQGTFNNILQSMSEGAKAVRLVVSRPLQQLRNSFPRFLPGGGGSTTPRPRPNRPQKQTLDLSAVHYHYDDFGNRIENPKEYLQQFKNSVSHSHSHIGDASALPSHVIKDLEMKEELRFEKDVDAGTAFSSSFDFGKMPSFKSNFHNSQFNSFGGFDTSSVTTHDDTVSDWKPMQKSKPASALHTSLTGGSSDGIFGSPSKFFSNRPVSNFRSVKHYDSDRPSTSYSFHHFASPNVDYGVDTKEKEGSSFGSPLGSGSMKVQKTQNFDHFYDYYDKKQKDYHGSESQVQSVAEHSVMEHERKVEAQPLVQTTTMAPTTTVKPVTTTRVRPTTTRHAHRPTTKHPSDRVVSNTERPNYPEYFFSKPKEGNTKQATKFIPTQNVRDEEDLFKGYLTPPAKFVPQAPKLPVHGKEPVHIVMAQPVHDKPSIKAKEKFRKQTATDGGDKRNNNGLSLRKRYPTRLPQRPEMVHSTVSSPVAPTASHVPTVPAVPVAANTEGYAQNEVQSVEVERKYPKKYHVQVEATTAKPARAGPASSSTSPRGSGRTRGSVRFGARF